MNKELRIIRPNIERVLSFELTEKELKSFKESFKQTRGGAIISFDTTEGYEVIFTRDQIAGYIITVD